MSQLLLGLSSLRACLFDNSFGLPQCVTSVGLVHLVLAQFASTTNLGCSLCLCLLSIVSQGKDFLELEEFKV